MDVLLFCRPHSRRASLAALLAGHPEVSLVLSTDVPELALLQMRDMRPPVLAVYVETPLSVALGFIAEARTALPDATILALAADSSEETFARCLVSGATRVLTGEGQDMALGEALRGLDPRAAPETPATGEARRLAGLRQFRILDTPAEAEFDAIVALAAQLLHMPIALMSLVDRDRQWFKARVGLDLEQTPRAIAFCSHAVADGRLLVVPDAREDSRFRDNPLVTGEPNIRFYAGAPLLDANGHALGTLCVMDRQPRRLGPSAAALLTTLSTQLMGRLEIRRQQFLIEAEAWRRRQAEDRLRGELDQQEVCLDAIDGLLWDVDALTLRLTYVSASAERLLGYRRAWWLQHPRFWRTCIHEEDRPQVQQTVRQCIEEGGAQGVGFRLLTARGEMLHMRGSVRREPGRERLRFLLLNVTAACEAETRALRVATHDEVTGLPNRRALIDRLPGLIADAQWRQEKLALLFLDVDRFKLVNDTLGHDAGDHLLVGLGGRFRTVLRESDLVARLGGDEFAIVLTGLHASEEVTQVADKLLQAVAVPVETAAFRLKPACSIGISVYPEDARDAGELLRHADLATHAAKAAGGHRARYFAPEMNTRAVERLSLESDLRGALARGEIRLHYQPLFDVRTGTLAGAEALLRWDHPLKGSVPPSSFVPVAEETGLILTLGQWVLREACRQISLWHADGVECCPIAVNVSAVQLRDGFADHVRASLDEHAVTPSCLELELTETVLVENLAAASAALAPLGALGVKVAIDDFGTGYSSLAVLRRLPVSALKLDRAFVADLVSSEDAAAVVRAVVAMSGELGLEVTAEGVESPEQLEVLRDLGCDRYQGYLRAPALPPEIFAQRFLSPPSSAAPTHGG